MVLSLPGFVSHCLACCKASFFGISLRDLCGRLTARSTSDTNFMYCTLKMGSTMKARVEVRRD